MKGLPLNTGKQLTQKEILHKLRNPYGLGQTERRQVALAAADLIEQWAADYAALLRWAGDSGLDITCRH